MTDKEKEKKIRVRLIIEGRVQGVFFRQTTYEKADKFGVTGWVMNRPDGAVEVVAEGPRDAVEKLVQWCHHGPPHAHVTNVRVIDEPYRGEFDSFDIRFSGGSRW
ncbi:MAG: acylphosphatase [Candidatus Abyssubacteria bacterium]